ncbi:PQQ-binding-like beta-propeller repeat protein [Natrarchaeobaculum aegyptiacum]|uniref:Transcriptional regulator n=1 Tax=Natrarchaeobaculum aegyptiacum TaxID=745377 RepID=A0A2Z2HSY2_9EURY|nr:PQQ-binding-like beta-propeller repeat protein [Natrarchaeobaculum aegyptiacum]ARS90331.1 transcriptional regulator [Natrarchaeobaculum aegyptiacum]
MADSADTEVPPSRDAEAETADLATRSLGEIDPARSRHSWTRSGVSLHDDLIVVGQWDGTVTALEADSLEARWTVSHPDRPVGIATLPGTGPGGTDTIVVAGRGDRGTIAAYDGEMGDRLWTFDTAADVGEATRESIFYLPYVVGLESAGSAGDEDLRLYAAARRYERDGQTRRWHSTVYAFDPDGSVRWRYETDASPIALELDPAGERLAVGYNRCMGDHDTGLVVLEADTGDLVWTWDPGTEGDRRVGDVSYVGETLAVASHGDKRGYLLGPRGDERWHVDLAVETKIDEEILYAYPNHVHALDDRVAFVTGNTYALEGRETEGLHPNEHQLIVVDADGEPCWDADVGGFVHGLAADGARLVVPSAQHFRVRDPETHAVYTFDLETGACDRLDFEGAPTAVALEDGATAVVEEPVAYHDREGTLGAYTLHVGRIE